MYNIKKIILISFMVFLVIFNFFSVDSIEENELYIKAVELLNQAKTEYEKGEYDKGYELSEQAREYLTKVNQDISLKLLLEQVEKNKETANNKINELYELGADNNNDVSEPFDKALTLFDEGDTAYKSGNDKKDIQDKIELYQIAIDRFNESVMYSNQVLSKLSPEQDYKTAKDRLEQAISMKERLINDNIIAKDGNEDKNITEIIDSGKNAFLEKQYKESIEKSEQALALMEKIYQENGSSSLALMHKALLLLDKARNELKDAKESIDEKENQDILNQAENAIDEALKFYHDNQYLQSMDKSQFVLNLLSGLDYGHVFPRYYKVQLIPNKRDCLWRIAEKDFVYGDGFKWPVLFRANKNRLKFPDNPNLIYPWKIVEIPSLKGEKRKGLYDPKKKYPKFDPNKNYNTK